MLKSIVALLATALVAGCIIIDGDDDDDAVDSFHRHGPARHGVWDTVYAADVGPDAVTVTVRDNGCTSKDFIRVFVDRIDDRTFEIGFRRIREDYCDGGDPGGVALTWLYSELGLPDGAEVRVLNRVGR